MDAVLDTYWNIIASSRKRKASGEPFIPVGNRRTTVADRIARRSVKSKVRLKYHQEHPELYERETIKRLRSILLFIYGARCMKCSAKEDIVLDHIVSRFLGGTNDESNLQLLCRMCNLRKGLKRCDYRPFVVFLLR